MGELSISKGNSKLGSIQSISLPSGLTCRECKCQSKCYARKIARLRPTVAKAYQHNYEILQSNPEVYWREVEAAIMLSRYFRFHVSGDIPNVNYLIKMVEIAKRNPHCEILCFTKKYEIVNDYIIDSYIASIDGTSIHPQLYNMWMIAERIIPKNIHIIFSAWVDLEMVNPFSLPEAHVRYRDGSTTARDGAKECGGNCTECATTDDGCWILKHGEQVIFDEH